jgi:predicted glycosyltransferase
MRACGMNAIVKSSQTDMEKREKTILYISGSIGLGHITRDLAVARALRALLPQVNIHWLASGPARMVLENEGERIIPQSDEYFDANEAAARAARGQRLNIYRHGSIMGPIWLRSIDLFKKVIKGMKFDLVLADEAFEISYFMSMDKKTKKPPYMEIIDFIGLEPMTPNPRELFKCYIMNWVWSKTLKKQHSMYKSLFVGEPEDVPDRRFSLFLSNKRAAAQNACVFLGYILDFDPRKIPSKKALREKLGYGDEPLVVCSTGGTTIGRELLRLFTRASTLAQKMCGKTHMLAVRGPLIPPDAVEAHAGVEVRGYVPKMYEHFAACDLAVVQGGGASTLELTALNRPFLYFPLEKHFEQQHLIPERLRRHEAGIRMSFRRTTPALLARRICENLGRTTQYKKIPVDGAFRAAEEIMKMLQEAERQDTLI